MKPSQIRKEQNWKPTNNTSIQCNRFY